ncbi:transposable element Tc3 transposase [Trichonephila clavipes]|nr:transposable element Tc3 transposase [Trichonephila clavipes]
MACERKLLESEATTGFFVLLGTKGKKETLEWCMKANLIASRYECQRCKKEMRFTATKGVAAASRKIIPTTLFGVYWFGKSMNAFVVNDDLTVTSWWMTIFMNSLHPLQGCIHQRNMTKCKRKLNGYVNKQNCLVWSEANPQVYVETPLHPEKLIVWCALWAGGVIGPYFFKNDEGHNVTVNGDRYRAMITNFFIPELNNHDVQELWFQQDGATCHTARATIDLLKDTFGDRLISRFGPVNWPPRSCDLTPLDYFLWGYVKSLVYADTPQTLDHLEDNIRRVIADIRPQMLEKVIENWTSRMDYIRASRGSPMPEIIFKM